MSCWVVPTIAADLWGMPLSELLRRIRDGEIFTKQDAGFTFVDVAPYSKKIERPLLRPEERPATFSPLSGAELAALSDGVSRDEDDALRILRDEPLTDQPPAEGETPAVDEAVDEDQLPDITESANLGDWRKGRAVARRRRTPPSRAAEKAA